MEKKAAFFRFTFTFVFAIPAESSGGQFLMFKPTVFSEPFKIQTFSLNSNYFFVVVGNSFAQLYSSSLVLCCTFCEFLKAYLKRHSVESIVLTGEEFFFINWNNQILSSAHCVDRHKQNLLIKLYTCVLGVF